MHVMSLDREQEIIRCETKRLYTLHILREFTGLCFNVPGYISTYDRPLNEAAFIASAERFEHSPQRAWVHEQSESVELETLNANTFRSLLLGLFADSVITCDRVMVLFFFCSDLALRATKQRLQQLFDLMYGWATTFFNETLSNWIQQAGGWSVVLCNGIEPKMNTTMLVCIGLLIMTSAFYIKHRWLK